MSYGCSVEQIHSKIVTKYWVNPMMGDLMNHLCTTHEMRAQDPEGAAHLQRVHDAIDLQLLTTVPGRLDDVAGAHMERLQARAQEGYKKTRQGTGR